VTVSASVRSWQVRVDSSLDALGRAVDDDGWWEVVAAAPEVLLDPSVLRLARVRADQEGDPWAMWERRLRVAAERGVARARAETALVESPEGLDVVAVFDAVEGAGARWLLDELAPVIGVARDDIPVEVFLWWLGARGGLDRGRVQRALAFSQLATWGETYDQLAEVAAMPGADGFLLAAGAGLGDENLAACGWLVQATQRHGSGQARAVHQALLGVTADEPRPESAGVVVATGTSARGSLSRRCGSLGPTRVSVRPSPLLSTT
jgi:hypothetical protein